MTTVLEAVQALASVNHDHASKQNGVGFNKLDTNFGMSLASKSYLTEKQELYGYKMLRKYRKQLENEFNIKFEDIVNPNPAETSKWENPMNRKIKKGYKEVTYIECELVSIPFKYDDHFILNRVGDLVLLLVNENDETYKYTLFNESGYLLLTITEDQAKEMIKSKRDENGKLVKRTQLERI